MKKIEHPRVYFRIFCLLFFPFLYFFYVKYVPLIPSFQGVLLPVLLAILVVTSLNREWGTLFFVFAFPLINSLPYFFGIFEHIPHAPTALVLFLFYLFGWCIHHSFSSEKLTLDNPIFKPLALFGLLVLISSFFSYLRFSNFYPFVSDRVYELITNVNGVTAGGAIMSTLMHSLNYLTGFVFLFILLNTIKSKKYAKKILSVLLFSMIISVMFGFFQILKDMSFGNTPFWVGMGQINSTFKGPNSFGAFLAVMIPVILGMVFVAKRAWKALLFALLVAVVFLFPHVGTRSAFLGLAVAFLAFFLLAIKIIPFPRLSDTKFLKRPITRIVALLAIVVVLIVGVVSFAQSRLFQRLKNNVIDLTTTGNLVGISQERYFLWKEAFSMIKDYPITGVGVGAYIIELPNYYLLDKDVSKFALDSFRRIDSAENYFLHVSAEMGIIGLLFVFWIFFVLYHFMFKNYRNLIRDDKDNFLFLGVAAGLISLFSNLFFHSFIGDFEAKYTFWLLAGIVIIWGKFQGKLLEKPQGSRKYKVLGMICILVFGGVHFWNCTHSLSLQKRTEIFNLAQNFGLYRAETMEGGQTFQWSREYGGKTIEVLKPVIKIPLHASHPDIKKEPIKVQIYLVKDFFRKKRLLDEVVLEDNAWRTFEYSVNEEIGNRVILLVKVNRTWNPEKELGIQDARNLGVALGEIEFQDSSDIR